MTDEVITNEPEFEALDPELENVTQAEEPADPQPGDDVLQPEPAAPVEVVTVEDLLNRLTGADQDEMEEPPQAEEESPAEVLENPAGEPVQAVGMDTALKYLETIQQTIDHPALTTPFEDYTVTEALLLLLFLAAFIAACLKMLKGGFSWLR